MKRLCTGVMTLLAVAFCQAAAAQTPKDYAAEIADAVKYYVAMADYMAAVAGEMADYGVLDEETFDEMADYMDEMEEEFIDLYENTDKLYKGVLESVAGSSRSEFSEDAEVILEFYRNTRISLSDYGPAYTVGRNKVWRFKELRTGIRFVFEIKVLASGRRAFVCQPDEDSYMQYILTLIADLL